ncbi:MAG: hypothetical protein RL494_836 [Bacteroidota bacterium]|jgi:PIN domain nuclease of toxin-antitoxin system
MARTLKQKTSCVMDASVLLAVFNNEPYGEEIPALFDNAVITTFNLAEAVNSVLVKKGGDEMIIWNYLGNFVQYHYPLDDELSFEVIKMTKLTKPLGLSLGDRYCIALGKVLNIPIYTADRAWKQLEENLNVTIELIR